MIFVLIRFGRVSMEGRGLFIGGCTVRNRSGANVGPLETVTVVRWLMADVRREVMVEELQVDVDSDECRKPNCNCKCKREGRVEGSGETSVVSPSTWPGEKD